ncbi:MAG: methyltransferase domain-containing protein [Alphaproteobacteria bacterium]|nr:methyltransferase domain-containing protein [Alphaproteobacteria bacterium]
MLTEYTNDYLLDKQVKIFQPLNGYRASTDAVLLAAAVADNVHNISILDVGSGTGAISLCLAQRLQQNNVTIHGLEIQPQLAELANLSANANGFDFLHYHNEDIRQKLVNPNLKPCSFDIVITNPPYSANDLPSPNASKATAHNLNCFDLKAWLSFCLKMAKPFGRIYLIHRAEALPQICEALQNKAGGITILPIYSKQYQEAKRIIVAAQKDSKAPAKILVPFITHNDDGSYTESAQKILRQGCGYTSF